ncbi:hypothetical protein EJ08DRAFT_20029 [Tothia fuscella]|uniref:Secreted protein n=1 Tax=Tothia fuscella TaxID=1048955 RepID=A0A9P4U2F8_9PEZI|nr:hypothetical protein EJ08DRAFT_20029 [Tothia fuscella]
MSGRVLGLALATIAGVATSMPSISYFLQQPRYPSYSSNVTCKNAYILTTSTRHSNLWTSLERRSRKETSKFPKRGSRSEHCAANFSIGKEYFFS